MVDRFVHEGCRVIILDLNRLKGEAKAKAAENVRYVFGDVTARDTWEHVLSIAQKEYGRIDVVINNAGINHVASMSLWSERRNADGRHG